MYLTVVEGEGVDEGTAVAVTGVDAGEATVVGVWPPTTLQALTTAATRTPSRDNKANFIFNPHPTPDKPEIRYQDRITNPSHLDPLPVRKRKRREGTDTKAYLAGVEVPAAADVDDAEGAAARTVR